MLFLTYFITMKEILTLIVLIALFSTGVAATNHAEKDINTRVGVESAELLLTVQPVNDPPVIVGPPSGVDNGVQWPYNLTGQSAILAMVEYGSSTSERAAWPPIGMPINASVPKGTVHSEPPADCDDQDADVRPSESDGKLCGTTTHLLNPDSDGDGIDDLTVAETGNELEWRIDDETVVKAETEVMESVGGNIIILNVEGARERPELVEAIASESGLSKADSKKALDSFIYISMRVAYDEIDKASPYLAKGRAPSDDLDKATPELAKELDKASPKLAEAIAIRDARIVELEERIAELESRDTENSTKDSDNDGLSDGVEEDEMMEERDTNESLDYRERERELSEEFDSPDQGSGSDQGDRPGFVQRLLSSIFR